MYLLSIWLAASHIIHLLPFNPNALFAHISSTHPSFVGTGTIGIDHIEFSAKFFSDSTNFISHNFDDCTAAQTIYHVIAAPMNAFKKRQIPTETFAIFI
ncbi:hypothetical protein IKI14_02395 [bacterium]|nr:hypothetical protein [bacterium]